MFNRVLLFLGTNLLVVITISIITSMLGLHRYLTVHGIDYQMLAIYCFIWGMAGSLISLFLSKTMAKMAMGVVVVDPANATREERFLVDVVHELARNAGIKTMPEVGVYASPELNAFATGPSKNNALVAVSSGLMMNMNRDEMEAVLGHEITHITNGDMVTMTLLQGVVNAFTLFFSRILAYAISVSLSRSDEREGEISYLVYSLVTVVLDILFTVLGSILVNAFSRYREYRADYGGAKLAGRDNMIAALRRLQQTSEMQDDRAPSLAALKIAHQSTWLALFASHPPLEKRIQRLQQINL